jgi:hypothetical protein
VSFTIGAGHRQRSHSQVRFPRDQLPYFTASDSRVPQPGGPVSVFISRRDRVAWLYPHALGSLFRRLLRLIGLQWDYSTPPPHGMSLTRISDIATLGSPPCLTWNSFRTLYPRVPNVFIYRFGEPKHAAGPLISLNTSGTEYVAGTHNSTMMFRHTITQIYI